MRRSSKSSSILSFSPRSVDLEFLGRESKPPDFIKISQLFPQFCKRDGLEVPKKFTKELFERITRAEKGDTKPKLDLTSCDLKDEHIKCLVEVLSSSPMIMKLELTGNRFSDEGVRCIQNLLETQTQTVRETPVDHRLRDVFLSRVNLFKGSPRGSTKDNVANLVRLNAEVEKLAQALEYANAQVHVRNSYLVLDGQEYIDSTFLKNGWLKIIGGKPKDKQVQAMMDAYSKHWKATTATASGPGSPQYLTYPEFEMAILQQMQTDGKLPSLSKGQYASINVSSPDSSYVARRPSIRSESQNNDIAAATASARSQTSQEAISKLQEELFNESVSADDVTKAPIQSTKMLTTNTSSNANTTNSNTSGSTSRTTASSTVGLPVKPPLPLPGQNTTAAVDMTRSRRSGSRDPSTWQTQSSSLEVSESDDSENEGGGKNFSVSLSLLGEGGGSGSSGNKGPTLAVRKELIKAEYHSFDSATGKSNSTGNNNNNNTSTTLSSFQRGNNMTKGQSSTMKGKMDSQIVDEDSFLSELSRSREEEQKKQKANEEEKHRQQLERIQVEETKRQKALELERRVLEEEMKIKEEEEELRQQEFIRLSEESRKEGEERQWRVQEQLRVEREEQERMTQEQVRSEQRRKRDEEDKERQRIERMLQSERRREEEEQAILLQRQAMAEKELQYREKFGYRDNDKDKDSSDTSLAQGLNQSSNVLTGIDYSRLMFSAVRASPPTSAKKRGRSPSIARNILPPEPPPAAWRAASAIFSTSSDKTLSSSFDRSFIGFNNSNGGGIGSGLDFSNKGLTNIPSKFDPVRSATALFINLSANMLTEIVGNPFRMASSLCSLDLSHNQITSISAKFPKTLKRLDLSYNRLKRISSIVTCAQLEHLNISHNLLKQVEDLPYGLLHLDVSHNFLASDLSLRLLSLCPALTSLSIIGNPVVESHKNYRVRLISLLPALEILNDAVLPKAALNVKADLHRSQIAPIQLPSPKKNRQDQQVEDEKRYRVQAEREERILVLKKAGLAMEAHTTGDMHKVPISAKKALELSERLYRYATPKFAGPPKSMGKNVSSNTTKNTSPRKDVTRKEAMLRPNVRSIESILPSWQASFRQIPIPVHNNTSDIMFKESPKPSPRDSPTSIIGQEMGDLQFSGDESDPTITPLKEGQFGDIVQTWLVDSAHRLDRASAALTAVLDVLNGDDNRDLSQDEHQLRQVAMELDRAALAHAEQRICSAAAELDDIRLPVAVKDALQQQSQNKAQIEAVSNILESLASFSSVLQNTKRNLEGNRNFHEQLCISMDRVMATPAGKFVSECLGWKKSSSEGSFDAAARSWTEEPMAESFGQHDSVPRNDNRTGNPDNAGGSYRPTRDESKVPSLNANDDLFSPLDDVDGRTGLRIRSNPDTEDSIDEENGDEEEDHPIPPDLTVGGGLSVFDRLRSRIQSNAANRSLSIRKASGDILIVPSKERLEAPPLLPNTNGADSGSDISNSVDDEDDDVTDDGGGDDVEPEESPGVAGGAVALGRANSFGGEVSPISSSSGSRSRSKSMPNLSQDGLERIKARLQALAANNRNLTATVSSTNQPSVQEPYQPARISTGPEPRLAASNRGGWIREELYGDPNDSLPGIGLRGIPKPKPPQLSTLPSYDPFSRLKARLQDGGLPHSSAVSSDDMSSVLDASSDGDEPDALAGLRQRLRNMKFQRSRVPYDKLLLYNGSIIYACSSSSESELDPDCAHTRKTFFDLSTTTSNNNW
eukprot:gene102-144_t